MFLLEFFQNDVSLLRNFATALIVPFLLTSFLFYSLVLAPPPLQQLLDKKIEEFTFDSNSILEDRVLEKTEDRIEVRSSS